MGSSVFGEGAAGEAELGEGGFVVELGDYVGEEFGGEGEEGWGGHGGGGGGGVQEAFGTLEDES